MFIGSQRFSEQTKASRKVDANWRGTKRRKWSPNTIRIFVKMKARQLDRSSKDVEGLKRQIKMTRQAPEVQKSCPASQMDQWTSQS
ncbi:hypothetical protein B9Z55_019741 [Caenorhabditis nigoni]|uniref:Uncharacterized protein n=1 Tax=Caenorhabditis nigoni TaxID=1611254 RepID=A0A2G5TJN9_9PELO|nr:hypothetical protein B9Z55_019741 [Caenorhabditis nigoni]